MSLPDALSALHDPTTTQPQRHAAHVFCEQYKVTAAARLAEILPLIHASQPLLSRHFGLHAVEGVVQFQWEQLSPEAQLELRRSLLSVARDGLLPLAQEAHMVREKLAVLLVGIAQREWPARWTTMLPELVQLASAGNTPAHCVLLAMRTLIEDVCSEDGGSWGGGGGGGSNGSASSATDPRSALDVAAPDMLEWMHQRLRYHLSAYQAGPPEAVAEDLLVLRAALSALRAFATHLALGLLLGRASLLAEVVALLNAPVAAVRDEACELLIVLLGKRPKQPAEKLQLLAQVTPAVLALPPELVGRLGSSTEEEDYTSFKQLVELHVALAGAQLAALPSEAAQATPLASTLEALLRLAEHPAQRVALAIAPVWSQLLKQPAAQVSPQLLGNGALGSALLLLCLRKLVKAGDPEKDDSPACAYARLEYVDKAEWVIAFGYLRSSLLQVAGLLASFAPAAALTDALRHATSAASQAVQDPVAAAPPASLPPAALEAWCEMDGEVGGAPAVLCLDAAAVILEAVGKQVQASTTPQHAADKNAEAASAALRGCGVEAASLAGGLLEWRPQHPALELRRAQLLGALTPCWGFMGSAAPLTAYLAQLGAELDYLSPHDRQLAAAVPQGGSLPVASTPSQDVRRRLCVCLLRLAKDATAAMIACMPAAELLPRVRATLASRRLALDQEVSLCEALVLVANGTGSVSSQADLLGELLASPLRMWSEVGNPLREAGTSAAALLGFAGVPTTGRSVPATAATGEPASRAKLERARLLHLPTLLTAVYLRVDMHVGGGSGSGGGSGTAGGTAGGASGSQLCAPLWHALPQLCETVSALHAVWAPPLAASLAPEWRPLLYPTEQQRAPLLHREMPPLPQISQRTDAAAAIMWISLWLEQLREASYRLLALAITKCGALPARLDAHELLKAALLPNLDSQQPRHLTALVRSLLHPVLCTHPASNPATFEPTRWLQLATDLLPPVLAALIARMQQGVGQAVGPEALAAGLGQPLPVWGQAPPSGAGGTAQADEVVVEVMQRQLGREALAFVHKLFATDPPPAAPAGAKQPPPGTKHVTKQQQRFDALAATDDKPYSSTDLSPQGQLLLSAAPEARLQPILLPILELVAVALRCGDSATCHKALLASILLLPRLAAKEARWHAPLLSIFGSVLVLHVSLGLGKEGSGLEADAVTLLRELYSALLQAGCDEPRQLLLRDGGLEQASVAAFEATLEDGSVDKRGRQRAMKKMLQPLIDRQRRSAARG